MKADYIPELSEIRMVRRAPERPFLLTEDDARYIETCLRGVETAFGVEAFSGAPLAAIPGRTLIGKFIGWWRSLEPADERQREAHARLPGAIRLLDTVSTLMEELAESRNSRSS
ncbi:hypothetical protein [Methylocystis sp. S23]